MNDIAREERIFEREREDRIVERGRGLTVRGGREGITIGMRNRMNNGRRLITPSIARP